MASTACSHPRTVRALRVTSSSVVFSTTTVRLSLSFRGIWMSCLFTFIPAGQGASGLDSSITCAPRLIIFFSLPQLKYTLAHLGRMIYFRPSLAIWPSLLSLHFFWRDKTALAFLGLTSRDELSVFTKELKGICWAVLAWTNSSITLKPIIVFYNSLDVMRIGASKCLSLPSVSMFPDSQNSTSIQTSYGMLVPFAAVRLSSPHWTHWSHLCIRKMSLLPLCTHNWNLLPRVPENTAPCICIPPNWLFSFVWLTMVFRVSDLWVSFPRGLS